MKKTKTTTEVPATSVKAESTAAPKKAAAKSAPKKKSEAVAPQPKAEQTKAEQPTPAAVAEAAPKKPAPAPKAKAKAAKPAAVTPELPMSERVGLTAGTIWHYLSGNGETSVAKLIKELPEEEKIIQRSIGWLAQEDKIVISTVDRIEVVVLK
ncbi:winged helix-turn-helix domain-containing protein [Methylomonas methanica]|uniref:Winged helix-turn-helix protein DUF2582 n=1 Tax=Methylomonas methanica (strain DSM 25384 / MC09) TaxID=857087 RepID=F9ZVQ2_METMM|nr:winged helix-turn-helix domain-containing protein [Methylomonas methanica]AEF99530.1 Protein of unknown function DUF2582 [Methylomonas methanica MC09]